MIGLNFNVYHLHVFLDLVVLCLQSLIDLEERWEDIDIDMGEYKEKYHKIKSTDDLFQVG